MSPLLLVAAILCLSAPPSPETARAEYRSKKSQVARTADAHVELALWCESKGLLPERDTHLALALLRDPSHATARGLLGQVHHDGRWQRPESVAETLKKDADWNAKRIAYEAKRLKTPVEAEPQWKLANWCLDQGLTLEARAHLVTVIKLDPTRESAWRKLGYKRVEGRWITPAERERERTEQVVQAEADRKWRPIFERLRRQLNDQKAIVRAEAELSSITDPRAVPAAIQSFLNTSGPNEAALISLLGQIHSPASTKTLAWIAVAGTQSDARRVAVEILRRRDPREFIDAWIGRIRKPIQYQVTLPKRPGEPGVLQIQDDRTNLRREFQTLGFDFVASPTDRFIVDQNGLTSILRTTSLVAGRVEGGLARGRIDPTIQPTPTWGPTRVETEVGRAAGSTPILSIGQQRPNVQTNSDPLFNEMGGRTPVLGIETYIPIGAMQRDAERSRLAAEGSIRMQVEELDRLNDRIRKSNESALLALEEVTSQRHGADPVAWKKWWGNDQGYQFLMTEPERETVVEQIPVGITPTAVPQISDVGVVGYIRHSCFAAGTPLQSREGLVKIETLREGDVILTQRAADGSLSFQPILEVFHNPPSDTLRIKAGEETYVATGIHRFWKAGKGWTMARDLVAGDEIRTLSGKAKIDSIRSDLKQPVFNLKVAEGNSYLIGKAGALVHDNSIVEPEDRSFDQIQK